MLNFFCSFWVIFFNTGRRVSVKRQLHAGSTAMFCQDSGITGKLHLQTSRDKKNRSRISLLFLDIQFRVHVFRAFKSHCIFWCLNFASYVCILNRYCSCNIRSIKEKKIMHRERGKKWGMGECERYLLLNK